MIVRRTFMAGILTRLGCHLPGTGITVYLLNGGLLEYARRYRRMARAHPRSSTTGAAAG